MRWLLGKWNADDADGYDEYDTCNRHGLNGSNRSEQRSKADIQKNEYTVIPDLFSLFSMCLCGFILF